MQTKTEYLFDFEQMQTIVASTPDVSCDVFQIKPTETPLAFLAYLTRFVNSLGPHRARCLIDYQDHWMLLDIEKTRDFQLSFVLIDAANTIVKVVGLSFILRQSLAELPFDINLMYISSLEEKLQRDNNSCPIFAWDLSRWAAQQTNLHTQLKMLVLSDERAGAYVDHAECLIRSKSLKPKLLQGCLETINQIKWIDYNSLKPQEELSGFFMNTQTVNTVPAYLHIELQKWIVEKPHPERKHDYVEHNIRANYCYHQMRAILAQEAFLTENEFITREICALYNKDWTLGTVFRNAIANSRYCQVRALLTIGQVNVNEVPPSGQTALDRAEALQSSSLRDKIIDLLREHGASSGKLVARMFAPGDASASRTSVEVEEDVMTKGCSLHRIGA